MSRNLRYALVILVVILLWLFSGFFADDDDMSDSSLDSGLTKVAVSLSVEERYQPSLAFNARTEAYRLVHLRAETDGSIVEAVIAEGEEVLKGTVVGALNLEDRPLRVEEAKSLLEQVELEYQGALDLKAKGLISGAELARSKYLVDSAKTALNAAEVELSRASIEAPFDGILNERLYEVGDFIQKGQIFAELLQLDPIKAVFHVTGDEVVHLDQNAPLQLMLSDGRQLAGKLLFHSAKADPQKRTFKVEAVFDNPNNQILSDLIGRIHVSLNPVMAHSLPASILSLDTQGRLSVKTVDADQIVRAYPVNVLQDATNSVWVTGLPEKAQVIVVGQEYVGVDEKVMVDYRDQTAARASTSE